VSAGVRQASVTVPIGTHRFTVTALKAGSSPQVSAPSEAIGTADRPGAPTKLEGTVAGTESGTVATYSLRWQAASANGSDVLDYTVQAKDQYGVHTATVKGTSATFTVDCGQTYCDPTPSTVSVTARNARGSGAVASAQIGYSGPTPPPLPDAGAQLVSADSTAWDGTAVEGNGTTTLTLSAPDSWRTFGGTCSWTHTGNTGGEQSGTFPCGQGSVQVEIRNGYLYAPGSNGDTAHSIVFHAQGPRGSVDSAAYQWTTNQPTVCEGCQLP
jgi:hypothetical protein